MDLFVIVILRFFLSKMLHSNSYDVIDVRIPWVWETVYPIFSIHFLTYWLVASVRMYCNEKFLAPFTFLLIAMIPALSILTF